MNRAAVRRILVAYDIPLDKRRATIAHILEGFGDRVQYSVFVVDAAPSRILRLKAHLAAAIDPILDSILICDLGSVATIGESTFSWLGRSRRLTASDSFIV